MFSDIGTHWVALYISKADSVAYFDSFGVEHIPKEIKTFVGKKNIKTNILEYKYMIQECVDIFVLDYMLARKTSTEYTNLCSPNKKNDDIILNYFTTNV